MGSSKKQTVGYHYRRFFRYGLARGPVDKLLEFRASDLTAWNGEVSENTSLIIAQPQLFGGESKEGGIEGTLEVCFGYADQEPSALAASIMGADTAYRGRMTIIYNGRYGTNPYPKAPSFKIRRIFAGWDDGECWYPETAMIQPDAEILLPAQSDGWEYQVVAYHDEPGFQELSPPMEGWTAGTAPFGHAWTWPGQPAPVSEWPQGTILWARRQLVVPAERQAVILVRAENGCVIFLNGAVFATVNRDNVQLEEGDVATFIIPPGEYTLAVKAFDEHPTQGDTYMSVVVELRSGASMNPAHILMHSLTSRNRQAEPMSNLIEASFIKAADTLFAEGFGLCTTYDHSKENDEQFQNRILEVIAGMLSQDRADGRFRLDLMRDDYEIEDLPILGDADILEFEREPSDPSTGTNEVVVEWFDPIKKEKRSTTPLQRLGAIENAGGVVSETLKFPEIPSERLALRVAERELAMRCAPLNRFKLTTTRCTSAWRAGTVFRLQAPRRGIADMVCIIGEIRSGSQRSGAMFLQAVQEAIKMPSSAYVDIEPGVDTGNLTIPSFPDAVAAFEAPFVELAGALPPSQLAALAPEAGFLVAAAAPGAVGIDYRLETSADGAGFEDAGPYEFSPMVRIVEAATRDPTETEFTFTGARLLDRVTIGTAAIWGGELVRVDALDSEAGTITLGRGVGDTPPTPHASNGVVLFYDEWSGSDQVEYTEGESVTARFMPRSASQEIEAISAPKATAPMDARAHRPYAPGDLRVNGAYAPGTLSSDAIVTWAHRDRLQQADVLVDATEADVGPEAGVTYRVVHSNADTDEVIADADVGAVDTSTLDFDTLVAENRIEVYAVRGGVESYRAAVVEFQAETNVLWTPANLAVAPVIWLDDQSSIVQATGNVSQWNDRSGNAYHFTQGDSGRQPTVQAAAVNGRRAIRFNGVNQSMNSNGTPQRGISRNTPVMWALAVYKKLSSDPGTSLYRTVGKFEAGALTGQRFGLMAGQGSSNNRTGIGVRRNDGDSYTQLDAPSSMGSGTFVVALGSMDYGNRTGRVWVNGTNVATNSAMLTAGNTSNTLSDYPPIIGAGWQGATPNYHADIDLALYLVGQGTLPTDDEIERLFGWAAHYYGLQADLPMDHPYKDEPPYV